MAKFVRGQGHEKDGDMRDGAMVADAAEAADAGFLKREGQEATEGSLQS